MKKKTCYTKSQITSLHCCVKKGQLTIFASFKDAWKHKIGKVKVGCIEFYFENISPSSVNMKNSPYLASHT